MKILLTGATGYIGKRWLPVLVENGHQVVCCVRDKNRFGFQGIKAPLDVQETPESPGTQVGPIQPGEEEDLVPPVQIVEVDFLKPDTLSAIPADIDAAYYLIHSMASTTRDFANLERQAAENFRDYVQQTTVKQVIYLGGIVNNKALSKHLSSRKAIEQILSTGRFHLTTLCAWIIVGSGSASFEIIRDLVEKLPVMIAPRWLETRSHPIAIRNVIQFLSGVLSDVHTYDKSFDIGGPEVLTYKKMLLRFAKVRGLRRSIFVVPVMTPKLSSYWLYFITSTSYKLAVNLVNSMKVEVVGRENDLAQRLEIDLITYDEAVNQAFDRIEQHAVISSWTDAQSNSLGSGEITNLVEVPAFGCFSDKRSMPVSNEEKTMQKIWEIGGDNGWYYANWLWSIRGFIDKLVGGVGSRRGRKNPTALQVGDALDFWRVIYADKKARRLLLFAEMTLPGEAWLEFSCFQSCFNPFIPFSTNHGQTRSIHPSIMNIHHAGKTIQKWKSYREIKSFARCVNISSR